MIAVIFHWWLGVLLTLLSVATVVGLVGGYLKSVTAKQFPGKRHHEE
jgi:hypothetical protein